MSAGSVWRVKALSCAKPRLFSRSVAPGVSVSAVSRLDPGKFSTKSAQDVARCSKRSICISNLQKEWRDRSTFGRSGQKNVHDVERPFGRWGRQNVHQTVARAWFHRANRKKHAMRGVARNRPQCRRQQRWSIWCDAPAVRVCNMWQNVLARLCAGKHEWCCEAPAILCGSAWRLLQTQVAACHVCAMRERSWTLQNAPCWLRGEENWVAEATAEVAGTQREEVADERRGASANRSLISEALASSPTKRK